jgi:ElaB/YqjD/DUF883 family membrane-anchored ribosome-binding protein
MENVIRGNTPSNSGSSLTGDNTLGKVSSGAHAAVDSVAGAADHAARKVQPAISQAAAMAHQAVDKVADVAAPAAGWLAEQGQNLDVAQKKLVADTCDYVSANPLKSLGIAVAAGFILSRMMR